MNIHPNNPFYRLVNSSVIWFSTTPDRAPADTIKNSVSIKEDGVYCIWWKDRHSLPRNVSITLPCGKRGTRTLQLDPWTPEEYKHIALYVGKGKIRTRMLSHVKPGKQQRTPYSWAVEIFKKPDVDDIIKKNMGFTFVQEQNKIEQVYCENLSIGVLKPWYNLRLAS